MTAKKSKNELILVTGCGGLIGTRLQEALLSDFEMVGLDLREPGQPRRPVAAKMERVL